MTATRPAPHPLTPLEIASGVVVGDDPSTPALPTYDGRSPRQALEAALLPALLRAPCVISFSGGRDSSAMLALAVDLARREGLPTPVPLTLRYHDAPDAGEDDWQQLVIGHLRLPDWQRVEIRDELDLIGPFAQAALLAHGPLFPFNAYTYTPLFPYAAGGTLVTGLDGDGLLDSWMFEPFADVLARRRRPQPRDVLRLGMFAAARPLRRAVYARRLRRAGSWLTRSAEADSRRAEADELAGDPRRWDSRVSWWHGRRHLSLALDMLDRPAAAADVDMSHPLLDPAFLSAIAVAGGRLGPGNRTTVMRTLMSDLLPGALLARESKATFDKPFFRGESREFARSWDGDSVDPELVDPGRLRSAWTAARFPLGSAILLQATWLRQNRPN
ncbi:MAG: asparagine synthase-related protein [Actinomycetota bacterium]